MVFQKIKRVARSSNGGRKVVVSNSQRKKSQLIQAVSPYDELPVMQDLVDQLSPPRKASKQTEQREAPQQRQQSDRMTEERQQRDPPMKSSSDNMKHYRYSLSPYSCADTIPAMIEIPTIPTKSEDSEFTLDSIWICDKDLEDARGPRSLTPHPSFEEIEPTAAEVQYMFEAGLQEDFWPSDEESMSKLKALEKKESFSFWSNGPMKIWELEGGGNGKKEGAAPNRRTTLNKKRPSKSKSLAMF